MSNLKTLGIATVALAIMAVLVQYYGAAKYQAGRNYQSKICAVEKQNALDNAMYNRKENDIMVKRLQVSDVIRILSERGELRD